MQTEPTAGERCAGISARGCPGYGRGEVGSASPLESLSRLARRGDSPVSISALEDELRGCDARLTKRTRREVHGIIGDAQLMLLRLDGALDHYVAADDADGIRRLRILARDLGRRRLLDRICRRLPPAARMTPAARRQFLLERALPQVRTGGTAREGFWIDEDSVEAMAAELGLPAGPLLARTVRWMISRGSRQIAKLYVMARLSGDGGLSRFLEGDFRARDEHPRASILDALTRHLTRRGARRIDVLQRGDDDSYNPLSANLVSAELGGRQVVIKEELLLPVDYASCDGYSAEAALLEATSHPCVVRLLGTFRIRHHRFMVLHRAPGQSLAARARAPDLLPAGEALGIVHALADVLEHLHAHAIVYMDLKAKNIVYDGRRPTLVDFGMARRLAQGQGEVTSLLSSPAYVPPEMAQRLRAGQAADVFQLGVLLHELLCGEHPFACPDLHAVELDREGEVMAFSLANLHSPPRLDHPRLQRTGTAEILGRMLSRDPRGRPAPAEVKQVMDAARSRPGGSR